jgi:hypothetical protein
VVPDREDLLSLFELCVSWRQVGNPGLRGGEEVQVEFKFSDNTDKLVWYARAVVEEQDRARRVLDRLLRGDSGDSVINPVPRVLVDIFQQALSASGKGRSVTVTSLVHVEGMVEWGATMWLKLSFSAQPSVWAPLKLVVAAFAELVTTEPKHAKHSWHLKQQLLEWVEGESVVDGVGQGSTVDVIASIGEGGLCKVSKEQSAPFIGLFESLCTEVALKNAAERIVNQCNECPQGGKKVFLMNSLLVEEVTYTDCTHPPSL